MCDIIIFLLIWIFVQICILVLKICVHFWYRYSMCASVCIPCIYDMENIWNIHIIKHKYTSILCTNLCICFFLSAFSFAFGLYDSICIFLSFLMASPLILSSTINLLNLCKYKLHQTFNARIFVSLFITILWQCAWYLFMYFW